MNNRRIVIASQRAGGFWSPLKWQTLTAIALTITSFVVATDVDLRGQVQSQYFYPPPVPVPDLPKQLAFKITSPFTVAAVGDVIMPQPIGDREEPGFQRLVKIIRDADVGFGNMETELVDMKHRDQFQGGIQGTQAPKEVGASMKTMGFRIMSRATNHALDGGVAAMLSTSRLLDEVGIVHAGAGMNLNEARAAALMDTPKGRIGLVSFWSVDSNPGENGLGYAHTAATYRQGNSGGRPGVNPLRMDSYSIVTAEQLEQLRAIRKAADATGRSRPGEPAPRSANEPKDRVQLTDAGRPAALFKTGAVPGSTEYEPNPDDEREILRSIRNGKVLSDFLIATVHSHQGMQYINGVRTVSPFLSKFARQTVDNGADMFVTHGPHALQGVEIYKGKPIFYGLSAFVYQSDIQLSSSNKWDLDPPRDERPNCCAMNNPSGQVGMVAETVFDKGQLKEVRLHPVDLDYGGLRPMSRKGIPTMPSPELAQRVLAEMQSLSKPFGTTIVIKDNIGIIQVTPASATAEQGAKRE